MSFATKFALDGLPCLDPQKLVSDCASAGWRTDWYGKPNSFRLPRGKHPGVGWLLLTREQLDGLDLAGFHTLTITAGDTTIDLKRLLISSQTKALDARDTSGAGAAYLVELTDVRAYGDNSTHLYQYNVTAPEERFDFHDTTDWTWTSVLQHVWSKLPPAFGGFPEIIGSLPADKPRNLRFPGLCAWDVFNKILDDLCFSVVLLPNGKFRLVPSYQEDSAQEVVLTQARQRLLDTDAPLPGVADDIPETIRVYFPARYFAFQSTKDQPTAEDVWQTRSVFYVDQPTAGHLPRGKTPQAGLTAPVWGQLEALYDSHGKITNLGDLSEQAGRVVKNYAASIANTDTGLHEVYGGIHKLIPSPRIAGVAWHDLGGLQRGLVTEVIQVPYRMDPQAPAEKLAVPDSYLNFLSRESYGPPDLSRPHTPYARRVLGELTSNLSPCGATELRVLFWDDEEDKWKRSTQTVNARDGIGFSAFEGDRAWAAWHWQAKEWVIVSVTPQIRAMWDCVSPSQGEEMTPGADVGMQRLVVDKHSSLRLRKHHPGKQPSDDPQDAPCPVPPYADVILDVWTDENWSLLNKADDDQKPPEWTTSPKVGYGIHVGMKGKGYVNYADVGFTEIGGGKWTVQWPTGPAIVEGSRLVADAISADGDCVKLGWERKRCGLNGYYCVNGYDQSLGCLVSSVILYFDQGLLVWDSVQGSASTTCYTAGSSPYCGIHIGVPDNPCESEDEQKKKEDEANKKPADDPGAQGGGAVADLDTQINLIVNQMKGQPQHKIQHAIFKAKQAAKAAKQAAAKAAKEQGKLLNNQKTPTQADAAKQAVQAHKDNVAAINAQKKYELQQVGQGLKKALSKNLDPVIKANIVAAGKQVVQGINSNAATSIALSKGHMQATLANLKAK